VFALGTAARKFLFYYAKHKNSPCPADKEARMDMEVFKAAFSAAP
jgi:hypothetical protein